MRREAILAIAISFAGCSFQAPGLQREQDSSSEDWLDGFAKRKQVTIQPPALSEPLTGIPIGVMLEADADIAATVSSDGPAIAFTDASGTGLLGHELEQLVGETGQLMAWVRIPQLAGDLDIYLYYGGQPDSETGDSAAVWADSFASVWHLADDPAGAQPQFRDSAFTNHGSASGPLVPARAAGIAGDAMDFDGLDDYILIGDPADDSLDFGMESFSWSLWVYVEASANEFDLPWHKGGATSSQNGYCNVLGTSDWRIGLSDGSLVLTHFGLENEFLGRWAYLTAVVDREQNEVRTYADGQLEDRDDLSGTGSLSTDDDATISRPLDPFRGLVDEVRVYKRALSDDWIATEHANLSAPLDFLAIGSEEIRPGS